LAKFSLPKSRNGITRSSLRVPSSMLPKIDVAMLNAGFNRKQRSKWIEDITKQFLHRSDAANLIAEEFIVPGSTESIPVTISIELDESIDKIIEKVWVEEGTRADRSSVIRTAITQQLMAKVGMQLSPQETRAEKIAALGGLDEPST
jgi:metal-responsive CopG/Arc/MetJ family transcriptional regulator